jgi:hypothetical protein
LIKDISFTMTSTLLRTAFLCLLSTPLLAAPPRDYQNAPGQTAAASRKAWSDATRGDNLALGKKVTFSQKPDYRLTADDNDSTDLTDGKLSLRNDDRIWFNRDAVGWTQADRGVNCLIDLGSEQPVATVAARFLGGGEQGSLLYPAQITVLGSDDGKTFYELASLQKVNAGEKELAEQNPDKYFYLPETGHAATSTFVLKIHRTARYIGLHLKGASGYIFTDQIAVMKDTGSAPALTGLEPTQFIIHGLAIRPRQKNLVITTNFATPNYFLVTDTRDQADQKKPIRFLFDLPRGVSILKVAEKAHATRDASAADKNRWILENVYDAKRGQTSGIYVVLDKGASLPANATATFRVDDPDSAANAITAPVKTAEIPAVGDDSKLDVSLAWMGQDAGLPDYYNAFRHMGFNMASTFPRYATTDAARKKLTDFVTESRKQGFRILYNESAFHMMMNNHRKEAEIYNQIDGQKGKYPCPCYTGKFYQEEIQRIGDLAKLVHPDEIYYDIELWYPAVQEAKKCDRCQAAFKASGMTDWDKFMYAQGTRQMRDLFNVTAGSAPNGKNPISGLYNVHAERPLYELIDDFNEIYPKYVQLAMPSLYVQGNVQRIHDTIRGNYDKIHSRNIIPLLSAGTYGEFEPYKLQQMILESFLNGSKGITYYWFGDMDPMYWYYHAAALKLLAPYQDVLNDGKQIALGGDNQQLTYSAFGTDKEALVLVGNYSGTPNGKTHLDFSGKKVSAVRDVEAAKDLPLADLNTLEVKPHQQRRLHVTFQ